MRAAVLALVAACLASASAQGRPASMTSFCAPGCNTTNQLYNSICDYQCLNSACSYDRGGCISNVWYAYSAQWVTHPRMNLALLCEECKAGRGVQ